jgi:hypothetical protein
MSDEETYPILSVPDTAPKAIEDFVVTLLPPEAGGMRIEFQYDGETLEVPTSNLDGPFKRMKLWLEKIAQGQQASLYIDPEGYLEHLLVKNYASKGDVVRFTSWRQLYVDPSMHPDLLMRTIIMQGEIRDWTRNGPVKLQADVILPRARFITAFYEGLLRQWEKPDPRTFWVAWDMVTPEEYAAEELEEETGKPYGHWHVSMQSDVIERYLGSLNTK